MKEESWEMGRMDLFDLWKLSVIGIIMVGGILGHLWIKEAYFPMEIKLLVIIWLSLGFFYFYIQFWRVVIWISEYKEHITFSK